MKLISKNALTATAVTSVRRAAAAAGALGLALSISAHAGPISVPNGDFSNPTNAGVIGGGLIGSSGTNVGIGSGMGPWTGSYAGVLGLLVPPTLTIDATAHNATINGLLGINVLNTPVSTSGSFSQDLPTSFVPTKRYTVSVDLDTGGSIGLGLLAATNVGVAIRSGLTTLGSSTTAASQLVSLAPLTATLNRLTMIYDTGATVSGNVGIDLFNEPQDLLTANLLASSSFSNVHLNVGAITDSTTQVHVTGLGSQGSEVNTPFGSALIATITDQNSTPLEGVIVQVSAPATGASAVLTAGSQTGTTIETVTDANGQITVAATANSTAGCYRVTASINGVNSHAIFYLRNWSTEQMMKFLKPGTDVTTALQDSIFCDGFDG